MTAPALPLAEPAAPGLARQLAQHPLRLLAAALLLHVALWTLIPSLIHPILPMDAIEQVTWGRHWAIGNAKHPPLAGWLSEAAQRLSGGHPWSLFLLAQLCVAGAALGVFALGRRLIGTAPAVLGAIAIEGLYYANFMSVEFNANVVQYPLWAAAGWLLHRAVACGRLLDWAGLGLVLAAVLYGKYSVPVLILPLLLYTLVDRAARPAWRGPGPWLTIAVFLLAVAPNLWWLAAHDFLPFDYALGRGHQARTALDYAIFPGKFLRDQVLAAAPALLLVALLGLGGRPVTARPGLEIPPVPAADRRLLAWVAFGPLATTLALSAATGQDFKSHWGSPMLFFVPLWALVAWRPTVTAARLRRFLAFAGFLLALSLAAFAGSVLLKGYVDDEPHRAAWPAPALAAAVADGFRAATGQELRYVAGPLWEAGNAAFYNPARPEVLIDADPQKSPWIDMDDLRRRGAVVVDRGDLWDGKPRPDFLLPFPTAEIQPTLHLPWNSPADDPPLPIAWAIVPPQGEEAGQ